jgi:competence protein ComEC
VAARSLGPGFVLGAVLVGIALGEWTGPGRATTALVLGFATVAVALGFAVADRRRGALALCCIAAACVAGASTCRALDGLVHSPLGGAVRARADAVVDVTLSDDPDATRFSTRVLARVTRVRFADGRVVAAGGRTVTVDASGDAASLLAVLDAGDSAQLAGYFRPLDEFEARLRWRHAVGAFAAHDLRAFDEARAPLMRAANALRGRVLDGHRRIPEPQRALVAGFLLGDTGGLPDSVVTDFRRAGLSHLVAVSGENVAFVLVLVGPVLRRVARVPRLAAGLVVLVAFAAMTRFEPSVLRACAMAACSMLALAAGRPTAGLRALALAVTVLCCADPFLVHSVGFQLSCGATMGIALLGPPIAARVPGPRWFGDALGVTLGAQLAVAPLLLATFGAVPVIAIPANLVVAPFVGPLTIGGLVSGIVGGAVPGDVVGLVAGFPAYVCASVVLTVAHVGADVPLALRPLGCAVGCAVVAVMSGAAWWTRRATWPRARSVTAARTADQRRGMAVPPR